MVIKILSLIFLPFLTFILWISLQPIPQILKSSTSAIYSLGQIAGLLGITFFAQTLVFNTRIKILEEAFYGLNKVYKYHHLLGRITFILLLTHPLLLASSYLSISFTAFLSYLFLNHNQNITFGLIALTLLTVLLILTLWVKIPYHVWRITHQFLGIAFIIGGVHALLSGTDLILNSVFKIYMLLVIGLGITAYLYKTVFGFLLIKKYKYKLKKINRVGQDIYEIVFSADDEKIKFLPGQFVFIEWQKEKIVEPHPFSITSGQKEDDLKLSFKVLGDFTDKLVGAKIGDQFLIEGPYGKFWNLFDFSKKQIWIAGGIGITPFLSMLKSLPDNIYVDLFYSVKDKDEAAFLEDLKKISKIKKNFKFFLWISSNEGYLTGKVIELKSGTLKNKEIFICGPMQMMQSFRQQISQIGVDNRSIHSEEFFLR